MPNGSRAYVNAENDGTVSVVDCVKHEVIKTISLGERGVIKPMAVLLSHDASKLYVSTGRGHKIFVIDTATNRVSGSFEVGERPGAWLSRRMARRSIPPTDPQTTVSVVDLASQKVVRKVKVGRGPWGVIVVQQ